MEFLRQLFHGKGYIDGITIINLDGEILFSAKLNSKFSNRKEREAYQALVGQNFFDVFENLNAKNSSMIRAMEVGLPVYVENQLLQTKGQEGIHISSLSIPIKSGRAVVGAIDLSMEEMTDGEEEPESVELTSEQIPVGGAGKLKKHSGASFTMEDIIAVDEKMKNARDYIPVVAACDLPVMIYGETGTGKEVFAQSIHNASERRDKPFIAQKTVRRCRIPCSKVSYLERPRARLPGQWKIRDSLSWRTAEHCFSTRSIRCLCFCSQSFCGFCRTAVSAAWAAVRRNARM